MFLELFCVFKIFNNAFYSKLFDFEKTCRVQPRI